MKKKLLTIFMTALLALSVTACSKNESASNDGASQPQQSEQKQESSDAPESSEDSSSPDSSEQQYEDMRLKMNVTVSETSTWYASAQKLADDILGDTDGKVVIDIYPNEQLSGGNQSKGVEMVMSGLTDMSIHSNIIYSIVDERFSILSLPFFFESVEDADQKLQGEGAESIKKMMADKGVQLIGFGESGMRQLTNNVREVKTVDDLKGLKIRVPGMQMYLKAFKAMGANPVSMNGSEVFTSLQQGAIDGQENPSDLIRTSVFHEVQDYLTLWDYSYDCLLYGVNKKLYDSFPEGLQDIFTKRGTEAGIYQKELARELNVTANDIMAEESGIQIYIPTPEERQTFADACQPVIEEYKEIIGEEFMKPFMSAE